MIDYRKIAHALDYYQRQGFKYIDVPWSVSDKAIEFSMPAHGAKFPFQDKFLVASGEQSFIDLILSQGLEKGRYCCVTPCFRKEKEFNEWTKPTFIKVELIDTNIEDTDLKNDNTFSHFFDVLSICTEFFRQYLPAINRKLEDGTYDIFSVSHQIELGSYGMREMAETGPWIYATGCAEPRLSAAINKEKGIGYHINHIPKGIVGELSKIKEEVEEALDAESQGIKIMALVELADLYGSIEAYLEKHHPDMSMDDLSRMSDVTRRAFKNGHR